LEQVGYGKVFWAPQWSVVAAFEQITVEEQSRTFVGEYNGYILKMTVEPLVHIICNEFQKWCHISITYSIH
jgi:hypothetical protein